MLVGRAVAVLRQGHALAGRALAGRRATLELAPGQLHRGGRARGQVVAREAHVAVDDAVHVQLRGHREVRADVVEERARRAGEVVPVGREAADRGLTRAQHALVVARTVGPLAVLDDLTFQLPVDGAAD